MSRLSWFENGTMTANMYAAMFFELMVGRLTGFSSDSFTHAAVGWAVVVGIDRPLPGSEIRRATFMMAESWDAAFHTSFEMDFGRVTPDVPLLRSIAAMVTDSFSALEG